MKYAKPVKIPLAAALIFALGGTPLFAAPADVAPPPAFGFGSVDDVTANPCMVGQRDFMVPGVRKDGNHEIFVRKFSPAPSAEVWARRIETGNENYCWDILRNHDGGITIAGYELVAPGSPGGLLLAKVDPQGVQKWVKRAEGLEGAHARSAAVDSGGNVFVAGYETERTDRGATLHKIFMAKFDAAGNFVWKKNVDAPLASGTAYAVAVDADDNIYLAGGAEGNRDTGGGEDAFVSKYSKNRKLLWTRVFGTPLTERATTLAVGPDGAVYVGGFATGGLDGNPMLGHEDAFIAKLNANGQKLWTRQFGSSAHDYVQSLAVGPDGKPFVGIVSHVRADSVWSPGEDSLQVVRFGAGGQKESSKWAAAPGGVFEGRLVLDEGGSVYMVGPDIESFRQSAGTSAGNIAVWKLDTPTMMAMAQQQKAFDLAVKAAGPPPADKPFLTRDVEEIGRGHNAVGKGSLILGPSLAVAFLAFVL